jgi:hypothetical protein
MKIGSQNYESLCHLPLELADGQHTKQLIMQQSAMIANWLSVKAMAMYRHRKLSMAMMAIHCGAFRMERTIAQ